ncbi:MAG: ATP-binding cassette domain-containing protein [Acidimicrobiia bacterium]|nr:ATP-binding cassette domain-containing protein [Acidimicrobiia bacterium]
MGHLADYDGGVLVVSHDLPLLDESITSVLALDNAEIEVYRGNYTEYLGERNRRRAQREKERRLQDEKIAQLQRNVERFRGKTEKMARKAKTIETRMNRIKDSLVEVKPVDGKAVAVRFPQPVPSGRTPMTATGLAKAFGENVVFVDIDVDSNRGEKLLIVGLNGAGKTTLLRILAGVETPDLGEVELGYRATIGYYAQEHEQISSGVGVLEHLRSVSDQPDQVLRGVLGHFRLADKIDQDAATLSGGEKTKLALAMVVLGGPNILLLDEPTNNLDPQAKDALFTALQQYEGTLILVSHDTEFVAKLEPDRAIIMPDGDHVYYDNRLLDLVAMV